MAAAGQPIRGRALPPPPEHRPSRRPIGFSREASQWEASSRSSPAPAPARSQSEGAAPPPSESHAPPAAAAYQREGGAAPLQTPPPSANRRTEAWRPRPSGSSANGSAARAVTSQGRFVNGPGRGAAPALPWRQTAVTSPQPPGSVGRSPWQRLSGDVTPLPPRSPWRPSHASPWQRSVTAGDLFQATPTKGFPPGPAPGESPQAPPPGIPTNPLWGRVLAIAPPLEATPTPRGHAHLARGGVTC